MQTFIALAIVLACAALVLRALVRAVLPGKRSGACGCSTCPALKTVPVPVSTQPRR